VERSDNIVVSFLRSEGFGLSTHEPFDVSGSFFELHHPVAGAQD